MEMGMGVWILLFSVVTLISKLSLALTPDGVALLELKSSLNDSKNLLSNWIYSDASPCHWTGLIKVAKNTCGDYVAQEARALMLKGVEELAEALNATIGSVILLLCTSNQFEE
ncbi:LRR receptor-like serine threonine- kinase FEI 2 [Olea europaea subsp. europaea]|uniref:LRR receptor-like serine threonine- kinase FEI 2 n=1 Tax=Olea europaea subsp. europaea TaxID=158383 RepID=A0A8S0T1N7_OLEEU|nr:LRR receptor-like serine threonine- kinase FEI 2 [Olea europaea subsp. europaea]